MNIKLDIALASLLTLCACAMPLLAHAQTPTPTPPPPSTPLPPPTATNTHPQGDVRDLPELVSVPRDMTVVVLNEGGKYVIRDLKKLAKGDTCKVFKGDMLVRDGKGVSSSDSVLVRYAIVAQTVSGGCPMGTQFELTAEDYKAAQMTLAQSIAERHSKEKN